MQRGRKQVMALHSKRLKIPVEWEKTAEFKKAVIQLRILLNGAKWSYREEDLPELENFVKKFIDQFGAG